MIVAVVDVPAVRAFGKAAAGEFGHGGSRAQADLGVEST
jgi:hypothetical protein